MAEPLNVGDQALDGAAATNPPVSQEPGKPIDGAPISPQDFLKLSESYKTLEKELRGLQSRQDRSQKTQDETQRVLDEIKTRIDSGASFEDARDATFAKLNAERKDDLLLKIAQKVGVLDESPSQPAGNVVQMANETTEALKKYGFTGNEIDVMPAFALKGVEQRAFLADLALSKANRPSPSPTAAPSLQSGPPPPAPGVEKLTVEYQSKMVAAQGKPSLVKAIKEEYRQKGVPVDSVSFH